MTKSRVAAASLKKVALAAAFFIGARGASQAAALEPLKAAEERTQRVFDQVVKLHRRYAGLPKHPAEPLKSLLTELALYHDDEEATYLSVAGEEGKRGGAVPVASWAQQQLALLSAEEGDDAQAIVAYRELGERFAGRMVIEPVDGAAAEKAETAALNGEIRATLDMATKSRAKDVWDGMETKVRLLHEAYGSDPLPCNACGDYGHQALRYLWEALALDKADYKTWCKNTERFIKQEKSSDFQAEVWNALASGSAQLGKKSEAKNYAAKAGAFPGPTGIFKNLIKD